MALKLDKSFQKSFQNLFPAGPPHATMRMFILSVQAKLEGRNYGAQVPAYVGPLQ